MSARDDLMLIAAAVGAVVVLGVYVKNKIAAIPGAIVDAADSGINSLASSVGSIDPRNNPQWGWLPQGSAAPINSQVTPATIGQVSPYDVSNTVGTGLPGGGT